MKKGLLILLGLTFILIIILMIRNWTMIKYYEPLRIFEKISLVKNKLIFESTSDIDIDSLGLYFVKQPKNLRHPIYDTIILYNGGKIINTIPSEYGKNYFILKYKNVMYNKIGIWKKKAWYKHNYHIQVYIIDSKLVVNWDISNKYETTSGLDTISLTEH